MSKIISIEGLSKAYRLGQFNTGTLSNDINRWWHQVRGKEDPYLKIGEENDRSIVGQSNVVWSLRDINFEVEQGDILGIVGKNGAGKSTLLKVLSRITAPTHGSVKIKGRVASLLEVGTGFHPELTGKENVYLNGSILGMRKSEIKSKFEEIVEFSGVQRYIDTPVKRYSSGMYVRLAFAVAAHLESEILIVDEVLAVGDIDFQKKCLGKIDAVSRNEGRTILFVSHNMASLKRLCHNGVLLKNGQMTFQGSMTDTITAYSKERSHVGSYIGTESSGPLQIDRIDVLDNNAYPISEFRYNQEINIHFNINVSEFKVHSSVFVMILDQNKSRVFAAEKALEPGRSEYKLILEKKLLTRGSYSIHCFTHIPGQKMFNEAEDVCQFSIFDDDSELSIHGGYDYGSVFGKYTWQ